MMGRGERVENRWKERLKKTRKTHCFPKDSLSGKGNLGLRGHGMSWGSETKELGRVSDSRYHELGDP